MKSLFGKMIFFVLLGTAMLLFAAMPHSARAEAECSDRPECWPGGSAMNTGLTKRDEQRKTEKLLAAKHAELVKLVESAAIGHEFASTRIFEALKTQQVAWLKYRDEECELIGSLTDAGGTWPSTYAVICQANQTDMRLRRVRSAIRCVEKIPVPDRLYEQSVCLQQLAPLTNK
jgi:uncharacterized protein YecT (DUF1311 family)